MKKKIIATLLAIPSLIPTTRAEVTETVSQTIFTEVIPKESKPRKVTDSFWYLGLQGGVVLIDEGADPLLSATLGYKHRIGKTNFMFGGQITAGHDTWGDGTGLFVDFAPTISYIHFPGGFYNSFEASLGLGFGYRGEPSGGFAFTPELNLTYWFNWFGIGATIRGSFQKDYEGQSYYYWVENGNQFSAMARFAVRF